jgi:hypothetical protein
MKHVEINYQNNLKVNSVSWWFLLHQYGSLSVPWTYCCEQGEAFFKHITSGNTTFFHHFDQASKHHRVEWKHSTLPVRMFRTQPTVGRVMLTVVWYSQGQILEHYVERVQH